MTILFNNETTTVHSSILLTILNDLGFLEIKGIAVAVNQEVIPKSNWTDYSIKENDEIILIQATQGG